MLGILNMKRNNIVMYNNKMLTPENVVPEVRFSNYIEVKPGTGWGPRKICDFELILIVSGRFYYDVPQKEKLLLEPGLVLCIPPDELHTFGMKNPDGSEKSGIISCIHLELMKNKSFSSGAYFLDPHPPYVTDVRQDYAFHELFKKLSIIHDGYSKYRKTLEDICAKEIWLRLSEYWVAESKNRFSARIKKMVDYIRQNYKKDISRRDLSKKFNLAPEYINYIFKNETGMTPTEFIRILKIREGYRLIQEESMSIKEAAHLTGFCDEFYFSRIFKRIMKFPPSRICIKTGRR